MKLKVLRESGTFPDSGVAVFNNVPADVRNCNMSEFRTLAKIVFVVKAADRFF